jgi:hypothetical protein
VERLTNDPAYDDQAALSPDGKTLAFVSSRGTGRVHIWLLDLASRRARLLTPSSGSTLEKICGEEPVRANKLAEFPPTHQGMALGAFCLVAWIAPR